MATNLAFHEFEAYWSSGCRDRNDCVSGMSKWIAFETLSHVAVEREMMWKSYSCREAPLHLGPTMIHSHFPTIVPASAKRKIGAFTLVELVIVVMIIGIMAAATVPTFARALAYYRADAAAKRIQVDLDLAKKQALTSNTAQVVSFDVASHRYSLPGVENLDHPGTVYEVDLSLHPYTAQMVSAAFDNAGDADVEFNAYGVPDSSGTIVIRVGSEQRTVVVDPNSSVTEIQ